MKHIRLHRMSGSTRARIERYVAEHLARIAARIHFLGDYEREARRASR